MDFTYEIQTISDSGMVQTMFTPPASTGLPMLVRRLQLPDGMVDPDEIKAEVEKHAPIVEWERILHDMQNPKNMASVRAALMQVVDEVVGKDEEDNDIVEKVERPIPVTRPLPDDFGPKTREQQQKERAAKAASKDTELPVV